jgi:NitT/TauT family transport system substrate-binding protein
VKVSKPLIAVIVVAVIVVAGIGVALTSLQNDNKTNANDVRIGYLVGDLHQLSRLVLANATATGSMSLYEKYGINATTPNPAGYANGPAVMDAFAGGALDAAWLGAPPTLIRSINTNASVKIVAVANDEGSSIIAKDASIRTVADLNQKTVGTPGVGSIQHLLLLSVAKAAGMNVSAAGTGTTPNTIYWTAVPPVNQASALASGQIDAAVGWEPYGSDSVLAGAAHVVLWSGDVWPNHPCCVLVVSTAYATAHPDVVARLVKADIVANEWIANAEANPTSVNYTNLLNLAGTFSHRNSSVVVDSLAHTQFTYKMDSAFKSALVNFTNEFIDLNQITEAKLISRGYANATDFVNHLVDEQYINEAASVKSVN